MIVLCAGAKCKVKASLRKISSKSHDNIMIYSPERALC